MPYGYTHRFLYYKTPYDEFRRLVREASAIEHEVAEAQKREA